jgi:mono/diheme cytochrome c family protein
MPPFAKSSGGMLTDQQIAALAQGIEHAWGNPSALGGQTPPAYAATSAGDAAHGQQAFTTYCAQCHGADGTGGKSNGTIIGSLVDPAYLALISDQGLRSIIISGQPEQGMPDWRTHPGGSAPLTDQQVTDIVAWLTSHRIATPGQPYKQHP